MTEDVQEIFEAVNDENDNMSKSNLSLATTSLSKNEDKYLSPIERFNRLKKEINQIEADLQYYKNNNKKFNKRLNTLDHAFLELTHCKRAINFISNSENFHFLNKIREKVNKNPKNISFLSQSIYEKLNEHIINKIVIINKLKCDKPEWFTDTKFELSLTASSMKVRVHNKFYQFKESLNKLKNFVGDWDTKKNKASVSDALNSLKKQFRLLDSDQQNQLGNKLQALNDRITQLDEVSEEFYHNTINRQKIDDLSNNFASAKEIEQLIHSTIDKLSMLKNSHEDSAFIFVKLKDLLEQQIDISDSIKDNEEVLDKVKENMKTNLELMKKNLAEIRGRFQKIKEKKKV